jgi:hypothetical protein
MMHVRWVTVQFVTDFAGVLLVSEDFLITVYLFKYLSLVNVVVLNNLSTRVFE